MQRINLYRVDQHERRDRFDARRLALLLVLLALALATISGVQTWRTRASEAQLAALAAEREAATARLAALQAQLQARPDGAQRQRRLRDELAAKRALLGYLEKGPLTARAGFSSYLDGLARRIVDGVWLSRIELDAGGARLRLNGHAVAPARVPALIAALGESPAYAGRSFRRLSIERPEDADWRVDFVLASGPAPETGKQP